MYARRNHGDTRGWRRAVMTPLGFRGDAGSDAGLREVRLMVLWHLNTALLPSISLIHSTASHCNYGRKPEVHAPLQAEHTQTFLYV